MTKAAREARKNIPSLGFPEEFWDRDGDYFCRPRPDLVAVVIGPPNALSVEISHYRSDLYHKEYLASYPDVLEYGPTFGHLYFSWLRYNAVAYWDDIDCPLQAMAIIQHYLERTT